MRSGRLLSPQELESPIGLPEQLGPIVNFSLSCVQNLQHGEIHRSGRAKLAAQSLWSLSNTFKPSKPLKSRAGHFPPAITYFCTEERAKKGERKTEKERKYTHRIRSSGHKDSVLGSGKQLSLIRMTAPGLSAGIRFRRIWMQYLSDQLWKIQRKK